jgi:hypothetical protein
MLFVLGAVVTGCASRPAAPAAPAPVAQESESVYDRATVAGALMYDPPVVASAPPTSISRAGRATEAFAGYEELTATYYYLRQDDRQLNHGSWSNDRFERQAITQRQSVTYR